MPGAIAVFSYSLGSATFLILTALLLTAWRGRLQGGLLVAASGTTVLWGAAHAAHAQWQVPPFTALELIEILRNAAWFLFLLRLLGFAGIARAGRPGILTGPATVIFGLCLGLAALIVANRVSIGPHDARDGTVKVVLFGHLALAVGGLALVEQLYRNTRAQYRWALKFLCLGLGGLFAYDLYLYSHALLFGRIDAVLWSARGLATAFAVPLIAVAAVRNPDWSVEIFVSRHVVFHTAALLGAGVYLMVMAAAGYWVRSFGGTWGAIAQAVFLSGAVVLLFVLLSSGQLRGRAKVFLGKHFYKNRYDYREEWLRFGQRLSASEPGEAPRANVIRAVAEIVESPSAVMWLRQPSGQLFPVVGWHAALPEGAELAPDSGLVSFLESRGWVVFLDEYRRDRERYPGLELPEWLAGDERAWVVAPLMHGSVLLGFIVLHRSSISRDLNWEDSDLLKTVGRQCASYLALVDATQALADARQFDAFNRLSAYVVHDLKNLAAQLSLVVSNARRHRNSPGFIDDAIGTVGNATEKMNRLLAQLRKGRDDTGRPQAVELGRLIGEVAESRAVMRPPVTTTGTQERCVVAADPDRLAAVFEHLVTNAQEATPADGRVTLTLRRAAPWAIVEVEDTGRGMDSRFIAERLFRPFDTTKGNAGMGVGVYESREFVTASGGRLDVSSRPGRGTRFTIRLPLTTEDPVGPGSESMEMAS